MQLNTVKNNLKTNAEFTSMNFGIGDASVVIDILRNRLYEHKIRTLVQEYISNARDANVEAKAKQPIEITVPNSISPTFRVRDYGLGISPDRMQNVFVLYGASTKRGTDTQIGGFGIGAKSAWSYTDSFTIVTYIKGTKRSYIAHTGTSNTGRLDFIGEESTNEKNGTEIQVAVNPRDVNEFKSAIIRATLFWTDKPLYKGIADQYKFDLDELKISDKLSVIKGFDSIIAGNTNVNNYRYSSDTKLILDISGIPYTLDSSFYNQAEGLRTLVEKIKDQIVIKLNNGEVEVSASRESVVDNAHNKKLLNSLAFEQLEKLNSYIAKKLSSTSVQEQITNFIEVDKKFKVKSVQFKRYTIKGDWGKHIECEGFKNDKPIMYRIKRRDNVYRDEKLSINVEWFNDLFIIKNKETLVQQGRKVREYLKTHSQIVVFNMTTAQDPVFLKELEKDLSLKDFATLPVPMIVKNPLTGVKVPMDKEEFCVHRITSRCIETERITTSSNTTKWVWIGMKEGKFTTLTDEKYKLIDLDEWLKTKGYRLCGLADRSLTLIKGDANFIELSEFLKKFKPQTADVGQFKASVACNKESVDKIKKLKGIKDKFLVEMIEEYHTHLRTISCSYIVDWAQKNIKEVKDFMVKDIALEKKLKRDYPLVDALYYESKISDDLTVYLNAKHELSK